MPHEFDPQKDVNTFHSFEERLAAENPNLPRDQIHSKALDIFNGEMYPKQVRSFLAEKAGEEVIDPKQGFYTKDGKLIHIHYGQFDSFIEHATNKEERASLKLFQEMMVNAAPGTQVVSFDLSQGINAIQYVDIGVKGENGEVRMAKRVDVTRGKDVMNLTQAWDSLQTLSGARDDRRVVTDGVAMVGVLVISSKEEATIRDTVAQVHDIRESIPRHVHRDMMEQGRSEDAQVKNSLTDTIKRTSGFFHDRKREQAEYRKFSEKPALVETVQSRLNEIQRTKTALRIVAETQVGLAAVPLFMAVLLKESPARIKAVEKSIARHKRKELEKLNKGEKRRPIRLKKTYRLTESIGANSIRHKEKILLRRHKKEKKDTRSARKEKKEWKSEKRMIAGREKNVREVRKVREVREAKNLQRAVRPLLRAGVEKAVKRKKERNRKKQRKVYTEHPTGYRIYTVRERGEGMKKRKKEWGLESGKATSVSERWAGKRITVKERRRRRAEHRRGLVLQEVVLRSRERKGKKHFKKFPTGKKMERYVLEQSGPWILLSIIWYLTAVREQGRGYTLVPKQRRIPQQAVIFALGS